MVELGPGSHVDRYVVEKLLGRGGMASVWRVRRDDLGLRFALKVLDAPGRLISERLVEEGRIQATLRHPNIVSLVDVLTVGDRPALVLEFVDGPTLEELLKAHRLNAAEIDEVARGLLRGIRAAHKAGFVHRDLKPANVLMARSDEGFVPKIADFGLAKLVRGEGATGNRTRTGLMMGTPAYMAPEQFRSARDVDARADLYSLGVMFYELCTGQAPYPSDDLVELIDRVRSRDYPTVADLAPDLPARMGETVARAMGVEAADRFEDAQAMLDAWTAGAERVEPAWNPALLANYDGATRPGAPERRPLVPDPTWSPALLASYDATVPAAPVRRTGGGPSVDGVPVPSDEAPGGLRSLIALTGVAGTAVVAAAAIGVLAILAFASSALPPEVGMPGAGGPVASAPVLLDPTAPPPAEVVAPEPEPEPSEPDATPLPGEARPRAPQHPPAEAPAGAPQVVAAPAPAPAPRPAPVLPVPDGSGNVRIKGDATIELYDASGSRFKPGRKIPAGGWGYNAKFPNGTVFTGSFVLADGGTKTIVCGSRSCKVE